MYHPYFRGKQYELITVREMAPKLAASGFIPVIEPVRESLGGLQRALESICESQGRAVVILNPDHGERASNTGHFSAQLHAQCENRPGIMPGILLKRDMTAADALECLQQLDVHPISLVHAGFTDAKGLADGLGSTATGIRHIFFEPDCGKLYRRHFAGDRVLVRDGFERRRNRDHPPVEMFSDLHVTYGEEGMTGFGDFLIVGDEFSESGGPAYAVAIHLTFIDPSKDNAMFVYHFVSQRQDTPADPAGKFGEALESMMQTLAKPNSHIIESSAVVEFKDLYTKGHFPGLGYVKKLSMNHHIETLAAFLS